MKWEPSSGLQVLCWITTWAADDSLWREQIISPPPSHTETQDGKAMMTVAIFQKRKYLNTLALWPLGSRAHRAVDYRQLTVVLKASDVLCERRVGPRLLWFKEIHNPGECMGRQGGLGVFGAPPPRRVRFGVRSYRTPPLRRRGRRKWTLSTENWLGQQAPKSRSSPGVGLLCEGTPEHKAPRGWQKEAGLGRTSTRPSQ